MATNDDIAREYARARFDNEIIPTLRDIMVGVTVTIGTEAPPCYLQRAQSLGVGAIAFEPGSDEVVSPKFFNAIITKFFDRFMFADESHSVEQIWGEMFQDYYESREWVPDNQWS